MNLHEYQAKELLKKYNVPVQEGVACSTVEEALAAYEQIKEKLESELGPVIDEMAKEVLAKPKKKSNPKQFDGVKSDEPFVKTRTKAKTEKVLGEFQINNKEKVRKSVTKNIK